MFSKIKALSHIAEGFQNTFTNEQFTEAQRSDRFLGEVLKWFDNGFPNEQVCQRTRQSTALGSGSIEQTHVGHKTDRPNKQACLSSRRQSPGSIGQTCIDSQLFDTELKYLAEHFELLFLKHGVIYLHLREHTEYDTLFGTAIKILVPYSLRKGVMRSAHSSTTKWSLQTQTNGSQDSIKVSLAFT